MCSPSLHKSCLLSVPNSSFNLNSAPPLRQSDSPRTHDWTCSPAPSLKPTPCLGLTPFYFSGCSCLVSSCLALLFLGLCCICWCFLLSFSTAYTSFGWFHLKPWVRLLSNSHNSSTYSSGQDLSSMLWLLCVVKPSVWSLSSMILESDRLRFESWLYHLLVVWLGSGILSCVSFSSVVNQRSSCTCLSELLRRLNEIM